MKHAAHARSRLPIALLVRRAIARRRSRADSSHARRRHRARARGEPSARRSAGARAGRAGGDRGAARGRTSDASRSTAATREPITSTSSACRSRTARLRVIYPDIPDNYFTRASFQWPIYTAGRSTRSNARRRPRRGRWRRVETSRAPICGSKSSRAYWALVTATRSGHACFRKSSTRADAHVRDVAADVRRRPVPPNEVSLVEAQRSRQQLQLIEAQNILRSVTEDLQAAHRAAERRRDRSVAASARRCPTRRRLSEPACDAAETRRRSRSSAPERQALIERIAAARGAAAARPQPGRKPTIALTGARRLRQPESANLPAQGRVAGLVGGSVNVSWPVLGRWPIEGARPPKPRPASPPCASGSPISTR